MLALAITALGVVGGLVALLATTVVWMHKSHVEFVSTLKDLHRKGLENDRLATERDEYKDDLLECSKDKERAEAARELAEGQRDDLLDALVNSGDPTGLAAALNNELSALSAMSNVPGADDEGGHG